MLTKTIGEDLKANDDYIFDNATLPNATSKTSASAFDVGLTQGGVEIVVKADEAISVGAGQTLVIELLHDDDEDGAFTDSKEILSVTGAKSYAADEVMVRYTPAQDVQKYGKLKVTVSENLSTKNFTAYLHAVVR